MAQFVEVPIDRLDQATLLALLEEFASRDGTDYGEQECSLNDKISQLHRQLRAAEVRLVYDGDSEQWDLISKDAADELLGEQ